MTLSPLGIMWCDPGIMWCAGGCPRLRTPASEPSAAAEAASGALTCALSPARGGRASLRAGCAAGASAGAAAGGAGAAAGPAKLSPSKRDVLASVQHTKRYYQHCAASPCMRAVAPCDSTAP